jgi:hypothetical protein
LGHGVDASKSRSCFFVAKLLRSGGVSLRKLLVVGSVCVSFDKALLAVAVNTDEDGPDELGDGDRGLD